MFSSVTIIIHISRYTSTSENMIFTEDLKNMAHLVEDSQDSSSDIELVERMMKKFNAQNKELRFGNFVFGKLHLPVLSGYNFVHNTGIHCPLQARSSCGCSTS